jgi:hypothetical protein
MHIVKIFLVITITTKRYLLKENGFVEFWSAIIVRTLVVENGWKIERLIFVLLAST